MIGHNTNAAPILDQGRAGIHSGDRRSLPAVAISVEFYKKLARIY
jgi:hypothetical protein